MDRVYLGDGVYANFECGGIRLTTSNGIEDTNEIFLEPEVVYRFDKYLNAYKELIRAHKKYIWDE